MSRSWFYSIQKLNANKGTKLDEKKLEEDVRREFQKIMETVQESNEASYMAIPRFYTPKVRMMHKS